MARTTKVKAAAQPTIPIQRESEFDARRLDACRRETKVRVVAALKSIGRHDVDVNLDRYTREQLGPQNDLAIALDAMGFWVSGDRSAGALTREQVCVLGELSFDGRVLPVRGVITRARMAPSLVGVVPRENRNEAYHAFACPVVTVASLGEAVAVLSQGAAEIQYYAKPKWQAQPFEHEPLKGVLGDLLEPCGHVLKAGKVLALRGKAGRTAIARRMVDALGPLTFSEALAQSQNHCDVGLLDESGLLVRRPFRAPHHTVSGKGLAAEAELAQYGVLYLEDLEEFSVLALQDLRRRLAAQAATGQRAALVVAVGHCMCRGKCVEGCDRVRHSQYVYRTLMGLGLPFEIVDVPSSGAGA